MPPVRPHLPKPVAISTRSSNGVIGPTSGSESTVTGSCADQRYSTERTSQCSRANVSRAA